MMLFLGKASGSSSTGVCLKCSLAQQGSTRRKVHKGPGLARSPRLSTTPCSATSTNQETMPSRKRKMRKCLCYDEAPICSQLRSSSSEAMQKNCAEAAADSARRTAPETGHKPHPDGNSPIAGVQRVLAQGIELHGPVTWNTSSWSLQENGWCWRLWGVSEFCSSSVLCLEYFGWV